MARVDISVTGAAKLERLGRTLKDAGDKDGRRELFRAMQRASRPLKTAAKRAAGEELPRRGGLADRVAGSRFTSKVRVSGKNPGVRIVGAGDLDLPALDRGRIRKPVFGHRRVWVTQLIEPGWFTNSQQEQAPAVRREIVRSLDDLADTMKAKV